MKPIIKVENLSKQYKIGESKAPYSTLRDSIVDTIRNPFKSLKKDDDGNKFWALKDISFEINPGEVVGIIGRNGAGKSTLLKILSRITEPTTGEIELYGRVGSLLEVGTGFHAELSGRENIFLNGAILGMKRSEISKKFDEIVAFAEVGKFIDTPVKHYSSGMYVRLAFAVAAHLEPEILIVDEVLAVGDAQFQKKCLKKVEEVSKTDNKTVLLVSHSMQTISSFCSRAILLERGNIKSDGNPETVTKAYLDTGFSIRSLRKWEKLEERPGDAIAKLVSIKAISENGDNLENFKTSEPVGIQMEYEVLEEGHILWQGYNFYNSEGINIFDSHNVNSRWYTEPHMIGKFISTAWIPPNLLAEGSIIVSCAIFNHAKHKVHFHEKDVIAFSVFDPAEEFTAKGESPGSMPGVVRPFLRWENRFTEEK